MFSVLNLNLYNETESADININGVSGSIKEFSSELLSIFSKNTGIETENFSKRGIEQNAILLYPGGYPIGLKLYADGVVIVGTESVDTNVGFVNPAERSGLKTGDIIKKINGISVNTNNEVSSFIEKSSGESLTFLIEREGEIIDISFKTAFSVSENKHKAGIWIRDSSAGIGTVTFTTQKGFFAALGHAVCDIDTKTTLPISEGECTNAQITGYIPGRDGTAGELCGYLDKESTGCVYSNEDIGVYGEFYTNKMVGTPLALANSDEIELGKAEIYTTIENGVIETFSIDIEKIDKDSTDNKNLIIKITDKALIEKTGGIIQGMSGSPIIQNGKIIGAVTHVFLNDPTGGYGIFAETMYNNLTEFGAE